MDRDRRDEQVLAWLMEEDLEDIEDPSFRADDIGSDRVPNKNNKKMFL